MPFKRHRSVSAVQDTRSGFNPSSPTRFNTCTVSVIRRLREDERARDPTETCTGMISGDRDRYPHVSFIAGPQQAPTPKGLRKEREET